MKKILKIKNYILAFIIPFIICIIFLYYKGILTNIEDIYVSDLRLQHLAFFNYLKNILLGKTSIQYSFYAGMGSPMISTIIFYCISPINILLLLIKDIRYAILFIYIIKISLSGLTMYTLLKTKNNNSNYMTLIFSTAYAFNSFIITYFFSIFWFDSIYLAPLVILGIDKIFKNKRINLLYIISLSLAIICNIQMGFGLCIFALLYFIYSCNIYYNIKKEIKEIKKLIKIFIISSLCAGAISSGIILCFISEYKNIKVAREIVTTTTSGTSNITYVIKNLLTVGTFKTDYFNETEPYIYCGLLISFLAIIYLFDKNIDKKKRRSAIALITIFIVSFSIKPINIFWHLSNPVLLNYRYSAYLSLFLTIIAYEEYLSKEKLSKNNIKTLIITIFLGLFMIVAYEEEIHIRNTMIFLTIIPILIYLTKNKSKKFEILLCIATIIELGISNYSSIYTAKELPFGKYSTYDSLKELASKNKLNDDYRVLYNYSYTDEVNDTFLLNKNSSLRLFSSVINGNVLNFLNRNQAAMGNNNYRISLNESPLLLSLLGNKYFYIVGEYYNNLYKKIDDYQITSFDYTLNKKDTKDVYLYENPYALSIGYVIEKDVKYKKHTNLVNYQNQIIKAFSGIDNDVMIELKVDKNDAQEECNNTFYYSCKHYTIYNNTNNKLVHIYSLYNEYSYNDEYKVYTDGTNKILISTLNNKIDILLKYRGDLDKELFTAATYNESNLIKSLKELQKNMIENVKINKNKMTANIKSEKNGILFLAIPYEKNYKIYLDNKKIDYYPLLDNAFTGFDIQKGEHDIKIIYENDNIKYYIIPSIIAIFITIFLYFTINKKIEKKETEELAKKIEEKRKETNKKRKRKK